MTQLYGLKTYITLILLLCFPASLPAFEVHYYETDALGTPITMVDVDGNRVWKAMYYPFGEERAIQETPESNDRRFIGKEKDKETGLTYFEARYMEANTGRFLSPDPVGPVDAFTGETNYVLLTQPQRLNRYAYGLNNPYRYVDPDGREIEENNELSDDADRKIENPFGPELGADRHLGVLDPKHPGLGLEFLGGGAASKGTPLWSSTKSKSSVENAFGHWKRHGSEFPELQNAKQYAEKAKDFLNNLLQGTLTKSRPNCDVLRYDQKTNTFGVQNADGAPKTMFRPNDGIDYWNKQ